LANSQQNTTPQILLIATYHFSWHFTFHSFALFFTGKISKRGLSLTSNPATSSPHSPSPPTTPLTSQFSPLPQDPKSKRSCSTVQTSNLTQIPYPPGWSKMFICTVPVSTITNIVNFSLTSGQFHPTLNESVISSMLKKPTLNKEKLSNYRLISNPSIISRIIEPVVKCRRMDHLTSNSLFNSHQSVYCKHQFTEIALLYIHDHLINAIRSQKISCLCLLDLSAAFDTIDHEISTTRLSSWFGIMALFSAGSSHIYHLVASVSNAKLTCSPGTHLFAVSPKALSLVDYSSSCTPLVSVPLFSVVP